MTYSTYTTGSNKSHVWAYYFTGRRPGIHWHVAAMDGWGLSSFAVVDDFGTLVPVK